jgi:lipoate-protein ligase A
MQFLDLTLPSLEENLAFDEALLLQAEEGGGEWLRVWEWPAFAVVLGAAGRLSEDVNEAACLADGVPILRRASGGGTVVLGCGCLLFSLVLNIQRAAELTEILPSYQYILGRIRDALAVFQADLQVAGPSDLAVGGRKVSGNSQQRKRHHLLHHGTLLYDFELAKVARYLHIPRRQPGYRAGRRHGEFLVNLSARAGELRNSLRSCWQARQETQAWPDEAVKRLVAEKYSRLEWIRRR